MADAAAPSTLARPTFGEALRFWLKLGFISFGGPAGQIAIMHRELVEQRRWIGERQFLHALNYCMLLPGPEAQQLATYAGWLLHGTRGGLVAGVLFVLPSAVILWALSWAYVTLGSLPWVAAIFYGLKPVVLAIVLAAVVRIGKKVLKNPLMIALAAAAWLGLALGNWPFPLVIVGAGILGWIGGRLAPAKFNVLAPHGAPEEDDHLAPPAKPSWGRSLKVVFVGLLVWWVPILAAGALSHWSGIHFQQGVFFSKTAMVTFGGAYAVLPYVAQQAVGHYGWLSQPQIMDGLGLAETTPGPLIMVLQFVGFVGAWQQPAGGSPLLSATLGAAITTWATFAPCFLWIFLGAPFIERLRGHRLLNAALSAITAAVVGVMLNLALWFGWHVLWPKGHSPTDWFAAALATVTLTGLIRWKWDVVPVVLGGGLAGLAWRWMLGW